MKFASLNLHKEILKGIEAIGFERCTPVQEQSLPESLMGKDIIAQAQTGTGKTAVFLLTILNKLMTNGDEAGVPRALIVVPTRELADQVHQDAEKLAKYLPFRSLAIFGGVGYEKQETALNEGVDILIATPGRLIDLYKSKTLSFKAIDQLVIDEADRMFDMGFIPDIRYIANQLPMNWDRQTMLFSATIDSQVYRLALKYMKADPCMIEVEPEQITVDSIDQKIIYVSNDEKLPVLMTLLKRPETKMTIVFTNMKITAEEVGWRLSQNGFIASVLTGDISQNKRQRIISMMKSGESHILVATDVAARGLHIDNITHVVNYDLPQEAAIYVHRIGRTARAGKSGMAYSLVCEDHVLNLPEIEKYLERKIEKEWIDESDMIEDKAGSFKKSRYRNTRSHEGHKGSKKKREEGTGFAKVSSSGHRVSKSNAKVTAASKPKMKEKIEVKKMKERKPPPKTVEARLAYYEDKYGDKFSTKGGNNNSTTKKTDDNFNPPIYTESNRKDGVLKKLFKVFGK